MTLFFIKNTKHTGKRLRNCFETFAGKILYDPEFLSYALVKRKELGDELVASANRVDVFFSFKVTDT